MVMYVKMREINIFLALEGVLQASLFDELSAATPSWENKTIIDQTKLGTSTNQTKLGT